MRALFSFVVFSVARRRQVITAANEQTRTRRGERLISSFELAVSSCSLGATHRTVIFIAAAFVAVVVGKKQNLCVRVVGSKLKSAEPMRAVYVRPMEGGSVRAGGRAGVRITTGMARSPRS